MTDPERISHRSTGLAAELLRAGATEQPRGASVERTLAALGVSGALLTTAATASGAAVTGVGTAAATAATGAKAVKAMSSLLLVKWIGVGVVSGVSLAGAAAVVSTPAQEAPAAAAVITAPQRTTPAIVAPTQPMPAPEVVEPAPAEVVEQPVVTTPPANAGTLQTSPLDIGAPLAAEVAFVDRARALLSSGQAEQGLSLLLSYEQQFHEARLLPEVLFLRLETCDRLGRHAEARAAAQRLVDGFPKSPHATRARKLLNP